MLPSEYSADRGFTLVEAAIAASLIATALVVLAHLAAVGVRQSANSRRELVALMAAQGKLEHLRDDSVPIGAGEDSGDLVLKWSVAAIEPDDPTTVVLRVCAYVPGYVNRQSDVCVATIRANQP